LSAMYGERIKLHRSDLFQKDWLPKQYAPFDAAVSSSCLHNLRDFSRIGEIYRDVHDHLRPGGIFLNVDLFNAPTVGLARKYDAVMARRRQREDASAPLEALVRGEGRSSTTATTGPFPADLEQHLAA